MDEPLSVKVLHALGGLQGHFDDFLRGEGSRWAFAAQFAPQQEPLHVSVAGVRVQKERCAPVLDRDAQNGKESRVTEAV